MTAQGSYDEGYKIGRALWSLHSEGNWSPLHAVSAVRTGTIILVTFHVPTAPLKLENGDIADIDNLGLRWLDNADGNFVAISEITSVGDNQIQITLTSTPTGSGQRLGIGDYEETGAPGGPSAGPRTLICDSASPPNVACHQVIPVTT